jgi:hypothetical protein
MRPAEPHNGAMFLAVFTQGCMFKHGAKICDNIVFTMSKKVSCLILTNEQLWYTSFKVSQKHHNL